MSSLQYPLKETQMHRRDFLKKTATVLSVTPLVTLTGAAAGALATSAGIRIHEKFITNDRASVVALAQSIVNRRYRFLDTYQAEFYAGFADLRDMPEYDSAHLLWAEERDQSWLLDFGISATPIPGADKEGLIHWLTFFSPRNCNDWLMVPTLYERHIWDVEAINWGNPPVFPERTHTDGILSVTRGLLLWQWQAERLIAQSCDVSRLEAAKVWRQYIRQDETTVQRLQRATCDGDSLADIIDERTWGQNLSVVLPDHLLAGYLSEHLPVL